MFLGHCCGPLRKLWDPSVTVMCPDHADKCPTPMSYITTTDLKHLSQSTMGWNLQNGVEINISSIKRLSWVFSFYWWKLVNTLQSPAARATRTHRLAHGFS